MSARSVQRPLHEARANEYPHVERGMTLGTVIEHRPSGEWAIVTDVRDDSRIKILRLEAVPDTDIATLEDAIGCVEHVRIARGIAARMDGEQYIAPPERFKVLGPTHPEYQRNDSTDGLPADHNPE